LKFEVARQASSPSLCASVRAVPWADEAEQHLSRLVPSGCELSGDDCIFSSIDKRQVKQQTKKKKDIFKHPFDRIQ